VDADRLDLDLLRTFQAVHRARSMTGAAALLGISQPTVTARLHLLEQYAGTRLFDRGARGCQPLPAADELAARLFAPLSELEEIAAQLAGETDLSRATVRLGAPAELTERALVAALTRLAATGMRVHVTLGLADDLLARLATGRLDLVVSTVKPPPRTAWQAIHDEEFVLVASPQVAQGVDQNLLRTHPARAINGLPRIAYDHHQSIIRRWWRHVLGVPPSPDPQITVPDLRTVQALVEAGAGISALPRYLCSASIESGRLVILLNPRDAPINTFYLVTLPHTRHQIAISAAWDALIAPADPR
jgi:DNA-binding transcriptional LysR family regulator